MSGQWFGQMRNVELSTTKYIEDQIASNWSDITVVKGFPKRDKDPLPVIAVTVDSNLPTRKEIGSTALNNTYFVIIDIFAKSNGQRLDLAQFIQNIVNGVWTYYTHSRLSGSSTGELDLTSAGFISIIDFVQNSKVEFFDDVDVYDKHRHIVSFNVRVN